MNFDFEGTLAENERAEVETSARARAIEFRRRHQHKLSVIAHSHICGDCFAVMQCGNAQCVKPVNVACGCLERAWGRL